MKAAFLLLFYTSIATAEVSNIVSPSSLNASDRDAITRVAIAEANTQGEAGLAGVVFVILNRLKHGGFGGNITEILNAHVQFEPVSKAGGAWSNLPKPSKNQATKINTILNLALSGHFPDPTKGALYFQNPDIVAKREQKGSVSKGLTHFGGSTPSLIIKDHAFYIDIKNGHKSASKPKQPKQIKSWSVFENTNYETGHKNFKVWVN